MSDMVGLVKKSIACVLAFLVVVFIGHCADKPTAPEILETTISGRVVDAETSVMIEHFGSLFGTHSHSW
jgi:hypothetical protein